MPEILPSLNDFKNITGEQFKLVFFSMMAITPQRRNSLIENTLLYSWRLIFRCNYTHSSFHGYVETPRNNPLHLGNCSCVPLCPALWLLSTAMDGGRKLCHEINWTHTQHLNLKHYGYIITFLLVCKKTAMVFFHINYVTFSGDLHHF